MHTMSLCMHLADQLQVPALVCTQFITIFAESGRQLHPALRTALFVTC